MARAGIPYAESESGSSTSSIARNRFLFRLDSRCNGCGRCGSRMSCDASFRPTVSTPVNREAYFAGRLTIDPSHQ